MELDPQKRRQPLYAFLVVAFVAWLMLAPASAHVTKSFAHLWNQHAKPKLASPGQLNRLSNPVDWTKLKSVPETLADCANSNTCGDLGGVHTSNGVLGGGASGDVSIAIDSGYTQRRITASCAPDSSIRSIGQDGSVTCEVDNVVPTEATLTGVYRIIAGISGPAPSPANTFSATDGSFAVPLPSAPTAHFIAIGTSPPAACPGSPSDPQAQPGNLCVYESDNVNATGVTVVDPILNAPGSSRFGFSIQAQSQVAGNFREQGSWAVTPP